MTAEEWDELRWLEYAFEYLEPHRYDRKLRLFTVACLFASRHHFPDDRTRHVVELSEAYSDDPSVYPELLAAVELLETLPWDDPIRIVTNAAVVRSASYCDSARRYRAAVSAIINHRTRMKGPFDRWILETEAKWHEQFAFLNLLRCIVGNPFRPVTFAPGWRSETAVALATGIYTDRAFDRLPILADALEEAGCDHADALSHCRGPGPHARGCWVVDLVLDKS